MFLILELFDLGYKVGNVWLHADQTAPCCCWLYWRLQSWNGDSGETCARQWSAIFFHVICNVIFRCEHFVTQATDKTITNVHFLVITYWGKLCYKATIHRKMISLHNLSKLTWHKFTAAVENLFLNKFVKLIFFLLHIWNKYFKHNNDNKCCIRPLLSGCSVATDCHGGCHEGTTKSETGCCVAQ